MICVSGGSEGKLAKAAGRGEIKNCTLLWRGAHFQITKHTRSGPLLEVGMGKNGTPLWREANLQVKMSKTLCLRAVFGRADVEKLHDAVVPKANSKSNY